MNKKDFTHYYDDKKKLVTTFDQALNELKQGKKEGIRISPNVRVQIITATAYINCTINQDFEDEYESDGEDLNLFKYGLSYIDDALKQLSDDTKVHNVSGKLHLQNVTMTPMANPQAVTYVGEMILFSDQIVGITLVE